ncbi:Cytoplasmic tRNA 2-thiolation protein 1 [Camellia lanceoleosa]|uniref:Cytoplasmic tRNA 2-thiolation protein 1 n=1 Tax=Camellia lanceoleosa TaxID=1840588 RepID=A0ACC0HPN7_9ERIC|nr:Cytoplasmic tRNA 2-thiolation protein 1 [Camellia lanceoleosa]
MSTLALDRGAALLKVDKLATGHNADDIAETVLLNILRGEDFRISVYKNARAGNLTREKDFCNLSMADSCSLIDPELVISHKFLKYSLEIWNLESYTAVQLKLCIHALDRGAALLKVDKLATGHNADDIAETVLLNILRG